METPSAQTNPQEAKRSRARLLWTAVLLAFLAAGAGGYYWYEQAAVKYDRITNAKRV